MTRIKVNQTMALSALLATALLMAGVACAGQPQPLAPEAAELTSTYIVQGEQAAERVAEVGGRVTHELGIINAVGAQLSTSEREALAGVNGIRIFDDRQVGVESVTSFTVLDEFNTVSYTNDDGTTAWLSGWVEVGDKDGAEGGDIKVEDKDKCPSDWQCLKFKAKDDHAIRRAVDLSG
ncbi:MAG: hypothetical protein KJO44_03120, partial [Gemmatimonadetes bacterium]|nr:hypothetical protein [Gemmatimonadota bacterium]